MHDLKMAVHPWEIQDDELKFEDTVYEEVSRYINKGVDGVFGEFPHAQYTLFQHFGSKANFPASTATEAQEAAPKSTEKDTLSLSNFDLKSVLGFLN